MTNEAIGVRQEIRNARIHIKSSRLLLADAPKKEFERYGPFLTQLEHDIDELLHFFNQAE